MSVGTRQNNLGLEIEFNFADYDWKDLGGQATHNVTNLVFSGLGYIPISNRFDVFGKIGFNFWGTDVDFFGINYEGDSGIDLAYGAGINFTATNTVNLRFEYQILPGLGDGVDEGDISQTMFDVMLVF